MECDGIECEEMEAAGHAEGDERPWLPIEVQAYVLKFTDARTLSTCAQVCRAWRQFAHELTRRHEWRCALSSKDSVSAAADDACDQLLRTAFRPRLVMFFVLDRKSVDASVARDRIRSRFPKWTHVIGCVGKGVIGMAPAAQQPAKGRPQRAPVEVERSDMPTVVVTAAQLPDWVTCSSFHLFADDSKEESLAALESIPRDAQLIVLLHGTRAPATKTLMVDQRFPGAIKIGGIVSATQKRELIFHNDHSVVGRGIVGIALGGGLKLQTHPIDGAEVAEHLRTMAGWQDCNNNGWTGAGAHARHRGPCKTAVGLLFTCVGRGESMHGVANCEANTFAREFPRVPLAGFFTGGEIHSDFQGSTEIHGYTSVYCVLHE